MRTEAIRPTFVTQPVVAQHILELHAGIDMFGHVLHAALCHLEDGDPELARHLLEAELRALRAQFSAH